MTPTLTIFAGYVADAVIWSVSAAGAVAVVIIVLGICRTASDGADNGPSEP